MGGSGGGEMGGGGSRDKKMGQGAQRTGPVGWARPRRSIIEKWRQQWWAEGPPGGGGLCVCLGSMLNNRKQYQGCSEHKQTNRKNMTGSDVPVVGKGLGEGAPRAVPEGAHTVDVLGLVVGELAHDRQEQPDDLQGGLEEEKGGAEYGPASGGMAVCLNGWRL